MTPTFKDQVEQEAKKDTRDLTNVIFHALHENDGLVLMCGQQFRCYMTDDYRKLANDLAKIVSTCSAVEQDKIRFAIGFEKWKSKLSPVELCTVHPPAGSGSGTGLYEKSDEDLINDYINQLKSQLK